MSVQDSAQEFEIKVAGKTVPARAGETILSALWRAGLAEEIRTGCAGGVCGACTVTLRFADGRAGGTDLACMAQVSEGMEVFPFPIDPVPVKEPVSEPDVEKLRAAYPTLDRCTKCGSCTAACPMQIPVQDSVLRMQRGEFDQVSQDFLTCIHCGLCRVVCEDKVQPHNMGIWVRRSLGMTPSGNLEPVATDATAEAEWSWLINGDGEERMSRAKQFREKGQLP